MVEQGFFQIKTVIYVLLVIFQSNDLHRLKGYDVVTIFIARKSKRTYTDMYVTDGCVKDFLLDGSGPSKYGKHILDVVKKAYGKLIIAYKDNY